MASSTKTVKETKPKSIIYVGPQIKGLQRYSSFIGGYPKIHEEHKVKCPAFTSMFIDPIKLNTFEKGLSNPNSVQSVLFNNVKTYFSEVNLNV